MSDDIRARVTAADLDALDDWIDRVLDAPTLEVVFDGGRRTGTSSQDVSYAASFQ